MIYDCGGLGKWGQSALRQTHLAHPTISSEDVDPEPVPARAAAMPNAIGH